MRSSSKRLSGISLGNGSTKDQPLDEESFQYFTENNFRTGLPGSYTRKDIKQPLLIATPDSEKQAALSIWRVILRFMGDMTDYKATTTTTKQPRSVMRRLLVSLGQLDTRNMAGVLLRLYDHLGLKETERDMKRRESIAPEHVTLEQHQDRIDEVSRQMKQRGGTIRRLKASLSRKFKFRPQEEHVLDNLTLEESLITPLEQLHFIIGYGIIKPELRDEIYCQTCKQLVKNPFKSSIARGWLLFLLLAGCFPPSNKVLPFIIRFLEDGPPLYTVNCKRNLKRTLENGPRYQPPAFIELEAGLNKRFLEISVTLMDGTMHTMPLDAATTSRELCEQLAEFINLKDKFGFSIYIAMYSKVASLGNSNDHIVDSISQCEQIYRETENKEGPAPWRLFFRKELFSPWESAASDSVAGGLIFSQVVRGIMLGEYVCDTDQQLAVLAAQQYYIEYGSDISEEGLNALLPSYIPPEKLRGDESLRLWRKAIIKAHRRMFDVSDASRLPQDKVKQDVVNMAKSRWPMSFSRYYDVIKLEGPAWPNEDLCLAVNSTGLHVMAGGSTISHITYTDIVEVSDGAGPGEIIVLILVNGAAIKLSSADGNDLRHLLTFLLNGLKQRSTFAVVVQACDGCEGSPDLQEGDLVVLGRQAGAEALTADVCVGRNERTGEAGKIPSDHIYVLHTLNKPTEQTLKQFKTNTRHIKSSGAGAANSSSA